MEQRCGRCKQLKDQDDFQPSYRGRNGTYCRPCCKAYRDKVPIEATFDPMICLHCSKEFVPNRFRIGMTKYCSTQCSWDYKDARVSAQRRLARLGRVCPHCGGDVPESRPKGSYFCSYECRNGAHMLKRKLRNRRGISIESKSETGYLRAKLGDRDNWICGICKAPVSPDLLHPDPLFASVDHIIPVALGGTSDEENLRIVHLVCNLKKGARLG